MSEEVHVQIMMSLEVDGVRYDWVHNSPGVPCKGCAFKYKAKYKKCCNFCSGGLSVFKRSNRAKRRGGKK